LYFRSSGRMLASKSLPTDIDNDGDEDDEDRRSQSAICTIAHSNRSPCFPRCPSDVRIDLTGLGTGWMDGWIRYGTSMRGPDRCWSGLAASVECSMADEIIMFRPNYRLRTTLKQCIQWMDCLEFYLHVYIYIYIYMRCAICIRCMYPFTHYARYAQANNNYPLAVSM